jgi:uncharacterized protein YhaN
MYLNRLEIKGFGKLRGVALSFGKNMNIIYGENEAGKTTMQWFIKGMLYGLKSGRQASDGLPAPLKRFEPWGGVPYGGSLTYTLDDGSTFRVERNFETGTVQVFDSSYNNITSSFEIGKNKQPMYAQLHLGLDEETFERTALIRQMSLRLDERGSAALAEKLANVSSTGSEDVSFNKAEKALADALKYNVGTSRTRTQPLDRLLSRLEQLEGRYESLKKQHESRLSAQEDKLAAEKLYNSLKTQETYLKHIRRLIDIRRELDEQLKKEADLRAAAKEINELESRVSADRKWMLAPLILLFAVLAFAGLLAYSILPPFSGAGLLLSATACILLLIKGRRHRSHQNKTDFSSIWTRELEEIAIRLEKLSAELGQGIDAAIGMSSDPSGYFNGKELDMKISGLDILSLETAWQAESEKVGKGLMEAAMKVKYCEGLLNDNEEIIGELQRVEEEAVAIKEKIAYLNYKGKALALARDVLIEAADEIKRTYGPGIDRSMSRIISGLTSGRYTDLRGDDRLLLKVAAPEDGDVKNALELSGATADQMYFALRLAMTDLLTGGGEGLPLIMDEAFSQLDDNRTAIALKYLYNNYRDRQIILFTCKAREVELAREIFGDEMNFVELGVGVSE